MFVVVDRRKEGSEKLVGDARDRVTELSAIGSKYLTLSPFTHLVLLVLGITLMDNLCMPDLSLVKLLLMCAVHRGLQYCSINGVDGRNDF